MEFSISRYDGESPMVPWPSLAEKAFLLKRNSHPGEAIFYYDAAPSDVSATALVNAPAGAPAYAQPLDNNAPVFVLIHGLGDEADSWRHIIPLLNANGCRALALDLPGFGRSTLAANISLSGYADAVLRLIHAAVRPHPGGPPIFLAGSSMGALVAQEAALTEPELLRGIILLDGSIPGGPKIPGPFAMLKRLFSRKWYRAYRKNPDALWASLYNYYADLDNMPPEDKEFLRRRVMARVESPTQEQAFFAIQRSVVRTYLTASSRYARKVRHSKVKIMLIWGELDRIIPLSSAEAFKTLRDGIGLELIKGAGHLPQQEKPAETARIMLDFLCFSCKDG